MANTNAAFGFVWTGLAGDAVTPSSGLITMKITSSDTSVYGEFDPLMFQSSGYVTAFTKGTSASQFAGTFKSCEYYSTALGRRIWSNYFPGSGVTGDVLVAVQPAQGSIPPRFRVQSSGAAAVTAGNLWNNVDICSGSATSGSAVGGFYRSKAAIDLTANIGTTASLPFRIVGLWSDIGPGSYTGITNTGTTGATNGMDNNSAYNWVLVQANNYQATGI